MLQAAGLLIFFTLLGAIIGSTQFDGMLGGAMGAGVTFITIWSVALFRAISAGLDQEDDSTDP